MSELAHLLFATFFSRAVKDGSVGFWKNGKKYHYQMPDVRVSHLTEVNVTILQMNKRAVIAMVVVCEVYFALMKLWSKSDTFEKRAVCVKIIDFHSGESFQKSSLV